MIVQHSVELSEHRISDLIAMNPNRENSLFENDPLLTTVGAEDSNSFVAFVERV